MDNDLTSAAEIVGSRGRRRRRSEESLRQRAARASSTAFKVFHETRITGFLVLKPFSLFSPDSPA